MMWNEALGDVTLPHAEYIECGPEDVDGNISGYTVHFYYIPDRDQVCAILDRLWNIPDTLSVIMCTKDGRSFGIWLNNPEVGWRALRHLRKIFQPRLRLTGAIFFKPCLCRYCDEENVIWVACMFYDDLTSAIRSDITTRLEQLDNIVEVWCRTDRLILKVSKNDFSLHQFTTTLEEHILIYFEATPPGIAVQYFTDWVTDNSPHDW